MNTQVKVCKRLFDSRRSSIRSVLNSIERVIHLEIVTNDQNLALEVLFSYLVNFAHQKHHLMEETYLLTEEFQLVSRDARQASELLKAQHLSLYAASSWWMLRDMPTEMKSTQVINLTHSVNRVALQQLIHDYREHLELEETLIWKRFLHLIQPLQFSEAAFMLAHSSDPLVNCNSSESIDTICKAISKSSMHLM